MSDKTETTMTAEELQKIVAQTVEDAIKKVQESTQEKLQCPLGMSTETGKALAGMDKETVEKVSGFFKKIDEDLAPILLEIVKAYSSGKSAVFIWFFRLFLIFILLLMAEKLSGHSIPFMELLFQ